MITNVNGINMYYEIHGEGDPLLVLHGWGGCVASMGPIVSYYSNKYKVIAIDFPGHGQSDMIDNWNVTDYMNNLIGFMNNLNLTKVNIICHSFGGRVSMLLAALHPEMVNKLVLIDAGGMLTKKSLKTKIGIIAYKVGKRLMKLKIKDPKKYEEWLNAERQKRGSADYNQTDPRLRNTFVKVVNQNLKPYLKKIHQPTLIIWGEFDKATPVYMAHQIHKGIKGSQLHILENCAHFSYLDDFKAVSTLIDKFI